MTAPTGQPVIPSHEVSGTVAALGEGVTGIAVGDEVYGLIDFDRGGAAAEYVTVSADVLVRKPRNVSHVEAAALPLAALTAWRALVGQAALAAGGTVLVHGGAGGVGVYAVQLAASLGVLSLPRTSSALVGAGVWVRDVGHGCCGITRLVIATA